MPTVRKPVGITATTLTSIGSRREAPSRSNHGPSVRWVHDVLRHELRSGVFAANTLPSENQLIRRYNVSRGTIRRVMDLLRSEGLIERLRGTGTFILSPTTVNHAVNTSRDFAIDVNHAGTRVTIFCTHVERHPATDFIADKLAIDTGDDVLIVETITYLDGFPFSFRTAFHPLAIFPDGEIGGLDLNRSPYLLLRDLLGERPGDTTLHISAGIADESVNELLHVPMGSATLDTNRVIYSKAGEPIEYSVSRARGDSISFEVLMDGQGSED